MPTVPEYQIGQATPQVVPSVRQSSRLPALNFDTGIGRALQSLGGDLSAIAADMKREDDEAKVRELDTQFNQELRDILQHPETGYYNTQGKAAYENHDKVVKQITELRRKYAGQLKDRRQSLLFERVSRARVESALDGISRHASRGRKQWLDNVSTARINDSVDDAIANWTDPKRVEMSRRAGHEEIRGRAARNRQDPEITLQEPEAYDSALWAGVVERAANSDPELAQRIYLEHKGEIDGKIQTKLEKMLEGEVLRKRAQHNVDAIVATHDSYEAQVREAKRIKDPKLRDETVKRIDAEFARRQRIEREAEHQAKEQAWSVIENGGTLDDVPAGVKARLDGNTITAMERRIIQKRKGLPVVTDRGLWNDLQEEATTAPQKFVQRDLREFSDRLSKEDLDRLFTLQRALRSHQSTASKEYKVTQTLNRDITEAARALGIDDGTKDTRQAVGQFRRYIHDRVDEFKAAHGRDPTRREVQEILDAAGVEVVKKRALFGLDVLLPDEETPAYKAEIPGVPQHAVPAIVSYLVRRNLPVTEENIQRAYRAGSGR